MKRKGMIHDHPMDICMRNLRQKAERGKKTGTNSCTRSPERLALRKHVMCTRNMEVHVRRGTWRTKSIKKRDEKLDSHAAKKGAQKLVSIDCAKVLEKESSN